MSENNDKCSTPKLISDDVRRLLRKIGTSQDPFYVSVAPVPGARPAECHANVRVTVQNNGGEHILGWIIWEWPGKLIEGQLHSIYRSASGEYVDVTPQPDGERTILFCPDASYAYSGVQPDNVRLVLSDDRETLRRVRIAEQRHRLHLQYRMPDGRSQMPATEYLALLQKNTGRNDQCPCESGKKFKSCCGLLVESERNRRWIRVLRLSAQPRPCS